MSLDERDIELIDRLREALHSSQQRITKLEARLIKVERWHKEQADEAAKLQTQLTAARAENGRLTRALALAGVGVP